MASSLFKTLVSFAVAEGLSFSFNIEMAAVFMVVTQSARSSDTTPVERDSSTVSM